MRWPSTSRSNAARGRPPRSRARTGAGSPISVSEHLEQRSGGRLAREPAADPGLDHLGQPADRRAQHGPVVAGTPRAPRWASTPTSTARPRGRARRSRARPRRAARRRRRRSAGRRPRPSRAAPASRCPAARCRCRRPGSVSRQSPGAALRSSARTRSCTPLRRSRRPRNSMRSGPSPGGSAATGSNVDAERLVRPRGGRERVARRRSARRWRARRRRDGRARRPRAGSSARSRRPRGSRSRRASAALSTEVISALVCVRTSTLRVAQHGLAHAAGLDGDEALAEVVGELDEVRPAVAEVLGDALEQPRAPRVHVRRVAREADGVGLLGEHDLDVLPEQRPSGAQPVVLLAMGLGGDERDVRGLGELDRQRRHDRGDAAAHERVQLPRGEDDPRPRQRAHLRRRRCLTPRSGAVTFQLAVPRMTSSPWRRRSASWREASSCARREAASASAARSRA